MKRATWFVTVVLGLVVLAGCAGPAVQEALPEGTVELSAVTTSLDQIEVYGEIGNYDGCGYESVWFSAIDATHDDGFGGKTRERYVSLYRYAYDWCADVDEGHWGTFQLDASAMRVRGNLGAADLRVDVELTEGYGDGGPVRVVMDLVLVGSGDLQTTTTKQQWDGGDGKVKTQTTDKYRQAEVTGTVLVRGEPVEVENADHRWGALRSVSTKATYTGVKATKPSKDVSIQYFYAWPDQIRQGEPAYLEWQVSGRDPITLTIEPDVGDVSGRNSVTVWPTETTTYTLTARNRWSEASAEVTVHVRPPLSPDACEPNDDRDLATPWDDACVATLLNLTTHDIDWFVIDLDRASTLTVDVDARWGDDGVYLDTMLAVFDETGDSIAMIDDWDWLDPFIEIDLMPGRYWVAITGYGDYDFVGSHWREGEYEVRFAIAPTALQVRWFVGLGTGTQEPVIVAQQAIVDAFNAAQSEIRLVLEIVDHAQAYDVLATQIAAGNAPDIVGPVGIRGRAAFAGAWLDLADLIAASDYDLSDFDPALVDIYRIEGQGQIGLPFAVFPSYITYNKARFDEAGLAYPPSRYGDPYVPAVGGALPWNVDTLRDLAMILTVDADGRNATEAAFDPGDIVRWGFGIPLTDIRGRLTMFGAGNFVNADGNAVIPGTWAEGAQWLHDAMWRDHFHPNGPYGSSDLLAGGNWFESGNLAMAQTHLWYQGCCMFGLQDDWALAPMVASFDGSTTAKLHADTFSITAATRNPEAAFAVLTYLLSPEIALHLTTIYGGMPARLSLQDGFLDGFFAEKFPGREIDVTVIGDSLSYLDDPSHEEGMPAFREAEALYNAFNDRLENEADLDVMAALAALQQELQLLFDGAP
jgi:multiple sugar transport system substrate-binding protein